MPLDYKHSLAIVVLLVLLFSAFFWTGFYAGRNVALETVQRSVPGPAPTEEPLRLKFVKN